jgi:hypothetical protein
MQARRAERCLALQGRGLQECLKLRIYQTAQTQWHVPARARVKIN